MHYQWTYPYCASDAMDIQVLVLTNSNYFPNNNLALAHRLKERFHTVHIPRKRADNIELGRLPSTSQLSAKNTEESPLIPKLPRASSKKLLYDGTSRAESFMSVDLVVEDEENESSPIYSQMQEIWSTVQLKAVWRPMTFIYLFNISQVPNVAWQSFLQLGLHFEAWVLGATVIAGCFMTFAGTLAYKYFFFNSSWRKIYLYSSFLTTFFSLTQLMLIFQINMKYLHLNNYLFALGDDVISAYIAGIQFLPVCIMYMRLCPEGAEGSTYAMLTTFGNIALVCANNLGNHFAGIWDVSNHAMKAHNYSGLWKLTVLKSLLNLLPLCLLHLLPANAAEQDALCKSPVRSKTAGTVFLGILFCSLSWTIYTAVSRIAQEMHHLV